MIDAKELRIGNWVKHLEMEVQLHGGGIAEAEKGEIEFEPIPLTPELLEACGFTMSKWDKPWFHLSKWEKKNLVLYSEKDNVIYLIINSTSKAVKYLHELQNLYHAITGEELEVKIPASTH